MLHPNQPSPPTGRPPIPAPRAPRRARWTPIAGLLLGAALFCWAAPTWASDNPHLERGIKLLGEMNDQKALTAFGQALSHAKDNPQEQATIQVYMGIAHYNLLKQDEAKQAFRKALTLDPEVALPSMVSPKIRALFEEVRAKVKAEAKPAVTPKPEDKPKPAGTPKPRPVQKKKDPRAVYRYSAFALAGLALAAGGTGLGMGLWARSLEDEAADLSLPYAEADKKHNQASTRALLANVMFGVAGAAAVTSAVLFYFGYRSLERPAASAALVPLPGGGALIQVGGIRW